METISKSKNYHILTIIINLDFVSIKHNTRQQRKPYKYKTGAVYEGEWVGGFRDGLGQMTWADGAQYIGQWALNKAHGKGKFIHVEGDIYDG